MIKMLILSILTVFLFILFVPSAKAAAPYWQANSAIAASTGADVTVTLPAHQANDIFLLQVWVRDQNDVITVSGWTQLATVDRSTVSRYWWFWRRAIASTPNPLVDKSTTTGDTYAAVTSYRGAETTGDPFEVKGTPNTATTAAHALNGISTLTADSLIIASLCGEDNTAASVSYTATNPATLTSRLFVNSNTGADGACASGSAAKSSTGATGTVTATWSATVIGSGGIVLALIPPPSDTSAPLYSNNFTSKASGTTYSENNNYGFQIRWTDTTGVQVVLFETNLNSTLKNHSVARFSGTATDGVYVINFTQIGANSYQYKWYANDTNGYANGSHPVVSYSVAKASSSLSIGGTGTFIYPYQSTATGTETNTVDADCVYNLYRDNTLVSNPETNTFGVGVYQYVFNNSACTNFTASSVGSSLTINQNTTNLMNMSINGFWNQNRTLAVGTQSTVQGYNVFSNSGASLLWRNGISVSNPDIQTFSVGLYEYKTNSSGNANYSANNSGAIFSLNVTPDTYPPLITINSPSNVSYPNTSIWFNITLDETGSIAYVNWGVGNKTMSNDSTTKFYYSNLTLPNGFYTATFYANDTSNNWNTTNINFTVSTDPIKVWQWIQVNNFTNTTINYTLTVLVYNNKTTNIGEILVIPDSRFPNYTIPLLSSSSENTTSLYYNISRPNADQWLNITPANLYSQAVGTSNKVDMILPVDPPSKAGVGVCSLATSVSNTLNQGIFFTDVDPNTENNATGNNGNGNTDYNLTVQISGCSPNTADVYIYANSNLKSNGNSIDITNEKFANSTTDRTLAGNSYYNMSLNFIPVAMNIPTQTSTHFKFQLFVPTTSNAGTYNNSIYFKTVVSGDSP